MTPPETPDCNHDAPASFAAPHGSVADPRVGKLTSEDAAMLKKLAEDMGALDCMPAWMRAEIEAKTKPPNNEVSESARKPPTT